MKFFINLSLFRRNRNFALLYFGQFISFIGTMITGVALPYQIYHLTHSTLWVGFLSFSQLMPLLVTALLGGALADRHHRRLLLLITEALLALGCLGLAWNAYLATPSILILFVVASFMSAVNGLHRPALESITQQLVNKEDYSQVGALNSFKYSVAMILGPAIGGLCISHFGLITTFILDFFSFLLSLIALLCISHIPKPVAIKDQSTWTALKEGFDFAFKRQVLVGSYAVDFVAMIFGMPMALFPAIAQSYGGVETLGLLYSAPAVGALFISFFSGWVIHVKRYGAAIAIAAIFWGLAIIGFGLSSNFYFALFFLALAGAFDDISAIFRMTLWNESIPTEYRGRLAGIEMISYLSGPKLGDTEAGLVAAAFGITASIVSGGILCVVGVAICCFTLPQFWRYKSSVNN